MYNEILVSGDDLKRFGVIPACFPNVEVKQTKIEKEKENGSIVKENDKGSNLPIKAENEMKALLKKYTDVISDTLTAERFLGKKADIYFNDQQVRPLHRSTA